MSKNLLFSSLENTIQKLKAMHISDQRKEILQPLIDYINSNISKGKNVRLNFICTHNSRRSQLAQVWAKCISEYYEVPIQSYSGGTEETAFHPNAIAALERAGFKTNRENDANPKVEVRFSDNIEPLYCYSKVYDSTENPEKQFAAVMTCAHADENCPFIPGAETRIALDYQDPKKFDGTPMESEKYDERSNQIASELIFVFDHIKK